MNWLEAHPATLSLLDAIIVATAVGSAILLSVRLAGAQLERLRRQGARDAAEQTLASHARAVNLVALAETRLRRTGEALLSASGTPMLLSGRAHAALRLHERALTRFPFEDLVGRDRLSAFEDAVGMTLAAGAHLDQAKRSMEDVLGRAYASSQKARLLYETQLECANRISELAGDVGERARRLER